MICQRPVIQNVCKHMCCKLMTCAQMVVNYQSPLISCNKVDFKNNIAIQWYVICIYLYKIEVSRFCPVVMSLNVEFCYSRNHQSKSNSL